MSYINTVVNKWNKKFLNRDYLLPNKDGVPPTSAVDNEILSDNRLLLDSCRSMYDSLGELRRERELNYKYYFGEQFCELMHNPDYAPWDLLNPDPSIRQRMITEEEYLAHRGMAPLSINVIRVACKAIVGLYTEEKMEPLVKARIRSEQKIGEFLTETMQKVYAEQNIRSIITRQYEEHLVSSMPMFYVGYGWNKTKKEEDVYIERLNMNYMFWSKQTGESNQYMSEVTTIGRLLDMTKSKLLVTFADSPEKRDAIEAAYAECSDKYPLVNNQAGDAEQYRNVSFYVPNEANMCRVIEVWNLEAHDCYACHDTAKGIKYTLPATSESKREIDEENNKRKAILKAAGGDPEKAAIIKSYYRVDEDWVCRFLTPNGYLLKQEVSPYIHGSHPFVGGLFPLLDGKVRSLVGDSRNPQRMINRTFIRSEYTAMHEVNGFKWVNKNILKRSQATIDDFRRQYTSPNGVIDLDIKPGEEKIIMGPVEQNRNNSGQQDMAKINFFNTILDKITGTPGAIRGERPVANTPSSLYAQETQNANNNLADSVSWYNGLIEQLDYKIMMVILQYYDKDRYVRIVGEEYIDAINYVINCDKKEILCDVTLIKSPSNGIARAETEDMLANLYNSQAIDAEMYLENTSTHGADKLLEQLRSKKDEQQQLAMETQLAQQQQPPVQ